MKLALLKIALLVFIWINPNRSVDIFYEQAVWGGGGESTQRGLDRVKTH